jgi:hypothetical protein
MWFGGGGVPRRMAMGSGEEVLVEVCVRLAWSFEGSKGRVRAFS